MLRVNCRRLAHNTRVLDHRGVCEVWPSDRSLAIIKSTTANGDAYDETDVLGSIAASARGVIDLLRNSQADLQRQYEYVHERGVARLSRRRHATTRQTVRSMAQPAMVLEQRPDHRSRRLLCRRARKCGERWGTDCVRSVQRRTESDLDSRQWGYRRHRREMPRYRRRRPGELDTPDSRELYRIPHSSMAGTLA